MTESQTDQPGLDVNRFLATIVKLCGPFDIGVDEFNETYTSFTEQAGLRLDLSEDQTRLIIAALEDEVDS